METYDRHEWGAVLLGFLGFFLAVGVIIVGMLPVALILPAVVLALLIPFGAVTYTRRRLLHH